MATGGNQAAISADVLGALGVPTFGEVTVGPSRRVRLATHLRAWRVGLQTARTEARTAHETRIEDHWQHLAEDYDESWRWRASIF